MKLIVIDRKKLFASIFFIIIILLILLLFIPNKKTNSNIETFNPIDNSESTFIDLTGDGISDELAVVTKDDNADVKITSNNNVFYLSDICDNKTLSSQSSFWPLTVYIKNISRNTHPEIIVQGNIDNKPINYIFTWSKNNFAKIFETDKNILGILDCNTSKTSQCCAINSFTGLSSFSSYMILDNSMLDITSDARSIPDITDIQSFIDLIQKQYEVEEIPDIFKEGISEKELSALWNLDKEHNTYSFQNAFFYDENVDDSGNISSLKWHLTFERFFNDFNGTTSNSQIVIYLTTEHIHDDIYKISSFYIN